MGDELNAWLDEVAWPRYADGAPVRIGDAVADDSGYTWTVDGVGVDAAGGGLVAYLFDGGRRLHAYRRGEAVRHG